MKILFIPVVGKVQLLDIKDELKEFQRLVGGYIEHVSIPHASMYIDEEGKLKDKPTNWLASIIYGGADYIAGDAVICGRPDDEGMDTDCPDIYLRLFGK